MVEFVVDKSLDVLLRQIDEAAPGRSKASDGSIGDEEHQARKSAHNPEDTEDSSDGNDPDHQVDARDFTHDPAHGADMGIVAEAIRKSRDRRVRLVIFNKRQFSNYSTATRKAWTWGPYTGADEHDRHAHVEANDLHNDDLAEWEIGIDMGLSEEDRAAIIGGKMTKQNGNVLTWRMRTIADSEDKLARETYPDWVVPGPGLKQLDERISKIEIAGVDPELIRAIVREEIDKTRLAS